MEKIQVSLKSEKILGTLHEYPCTFMIISLSILLRMRNFSEQTCTEKQNTYFIFIIFFLKNRVVYEMWKNMVQLDRLQKVI